ncbi:hypothetical protein HD554DRAFT_2139998 [Boletus coccyginus]|nr:hypothetical protein HD554DRAFT_2139998 [Boletus coccyginus]
MSSSENTGARPTPPAGHVHLVLFERQPDPFYLEIPFRVIRDSCRHPPKYLRYLGWCILGVEGFLLNAQGGRVNLTGKLADRGVYHYRLPAAQDVLAHAVDPEAIKLRSQVPSQTTATREGFREELVSRDGARCVWTGLPPGSAMHIIPWRRGDEWFQFIIENRPHGDEQGLDTLNSINDIRNGVMGAVGFHGPYFDSRKVVILKTPNPILKRGDVPERRIRILPDNASYPFRLRYTLQWIATDDRFLLSVYPNNSDAAFVSHRRSKPSDLLLHYNYGAAAVKHWGRNHTVLNSRPGLPRPKAPGTVAMGPTRSVGDRTTAIAKRATARDEGQQQPGGSGGGMGSAAASDSEQPEWDEDDVMLFFWGNSMPAMERHAKKEREREVNINKWRAGMDV